MTVNSDGKMSLTSFTLSYKDERTLLKYSLSLRYTTKNEFQAWGFKDYLANKVSSLWPFIKKQEKNNNKIFPCYIGAICQA